MILAELLEERDIRSALVVDDSCDPVPTAADMRMAADEWATFADDLSEDQKLLIAEHYPSARDRRLDELIDDDAYVKAVWELREQLDGVADPLFETYDANQAADTRHVNLVVEHLKALGVTVETGGRSFADKEIVADLVVIDLYFGSGQEDAAMVESKNLLTTALQTRVKNPPLVILMSRSESLEAKRDEFRDDVGLIDSGFRILRKADLEEGIKFNDQLERLAQNQNETLRLARFFAALDDGATHAAKSALVLMRRMKLSDILQIQQLLLDVEGEPTGSYLVDVFDRVFQHELEGEQNIIEAAVDLNEFSTAQHPPPYLAGSAELQELVARTLTQHPERLRLPGSSESLVSFGDLLRVVPAGVDDTEQTTSNVPPDSIRLVLTPACDLQRRAAPRVLLLVGSLQELTPQTWSYGGGARTFAITLDGATHWIQWDLKHVDTISWDQLQEAFTHGTLKAVARLRESHALELQQRVLAGLGRVGLVSPLPATFALEVEAYYPDTAGVPSRLTVPGLEDGAVCFVGRDENGNQNARLVLTERGCDDLQAAVSDLDPGLVAEKARKALAHIKESGDLRRMLSIGLNLKGVGTKGWREMDSLTGSDTGVPKMGLVAWDYAQPSEALEPKQLSKAGVMILVRTARVEGAAVIADAIRKEALAATPHAAE